MNSTHRFPSLGRVWTAVTLFSALACGGQGQNSFRVATYNVENYLLEPIQGRKVKPVKARAKVRESILAIRPDVIAIQEMGSLEALLELRDSLKVGGLSLPHFEHLSANDPAIHLAVLSRFPIAARRSHDNESYLLNGRRLHVGRGFVEVDIESAPGYRFTLLNAHLKSKRRVAEADEAEMRLNEAQLLRRIIDERLKSNPDTNLVVLGDLNDTYNSKPVKALVGRSKTKLVDTRPTERNGDNLPNPIKQSWFPRNVAWTSFYGVEDSYGRFDYLMLSPGMAKEWERKATWIPVVPNWGIGSDHRPLVATFLTEDK